MLRPRIRRLLRFRRLPAEAQAPVFHGSRTYWQERYATGGNSGVGSYATLAAFKADTLNAFVDRHGIASVLEFGCGDGNQLRSAQYPSYIGLDVAASAVDQCIEMFADDETKSFFLYDPVRFVDRTHTFTSDLSLSLDVIFHLVEDDVFDRYMTLLFDSAGRFVCVYSSNDELPDAWPHVRHRRFMDWVETRRPDWLLVETVENPYKDLETGAVSDFYFFAPR